jgi:hypothetical protein
LWLPCKTAASVAAARCLGSQSKEDLAADILAFNDLYPILLQDKTKPIVYIVFKLTAHGLDPSKHTKESLETTLTVYGDAELREAWCKSYWRGL